MFIKRTLFLVCLCFSFVLYINSSFANDFVWFDDPCTNLLLNGRIENHEGQYVVAVDERYYRVTTDGMVIPVGFSCNEVEDMPIDYDFTIVNQFDDAREKVIRDIELVKSTYPNMNVSTLLNAYANGHGESIMQLAKEFAGELEKDIDDSTPIQLYTRARRILRVDPTSAMKMLKRSIQLAPTNAAPYRLLGNYYAEQGYRGQACLYLQHFLELSPAHPQADDIRVQLLKFAC